MDTKPNPTSTNFLCKMGYLLKLFLVHSFLFFIFSSNMVESRSGSKTSLATRLKLDSETSDCWGTLYQLQACTGEVVTFFLTGETYLGSNCCQAIKVIQHECWPTLLESLGYTTEEGDILEAYCNTTIDTLKTSSSDLSLSIEQNTAAKIIAP